MKKMICVLFGVSMICLSSALTFAADEGLWKQEVSLGYTQKTGNTQSTELISNYEGIRKTDENSKVDPRQNSAPK